MDTTFWYKWLGEGELVWASRLTAGLYAVTSVLRAKRVLVPNNCCHAVVYGLLLAGAEPVFCEVDLENGGLDAVACEELLRRLSIDLVVQVHAYGHYDPRDEIHRLCQKHGAFLFEDAAVWFPPVQGYGVLKNSCFGLSFGERKIFDFGGGALLSFADRSLARDVTRLLNLLPSKPSGPSDYGIVYSTLVRHESIPRAGGTSFSYLANRYRNYWIGRSDLPAIALNESQVTRERARRLALASSCTKSLAPLGAHFFVEHPMDLPWRFSFRLPNARRLDRYMERRAVWISHLYPPLDLFFPEFEKSTVLRNSYRLSEEICNLPLNGNTTAHHVDELALGVRDFVSRPAMPLYDLITDQMRSSAAVLRKVWRRWPKSASRYAPDRGE